MHEEVRVAISAGVDGKTIVAIEVRRNETDAQIDLDSAIQRATGAYKKAVAAIEPPPAEEQK